MSNHSGRMKQREARPRIDRYNYVPITRGHKPTASQESNTLSTVSCMTDLSEEDIGEINDITDTQGHINPEGQLIKSELSEQNRLKSSLESSAPVQSETQTLSLIESSDGSIFSDELIRNSKVKLSFESPVRIGIPKSSVDRSSYERIDHQHRIREEPLKTLLSGLFLGTGFLATTFSLTVTHDRYPEVDPLPDVVFENVKYQPWGLMASEYILLLLLYTAVSIVLLHKHRLIILRRIWFLLGILYYYRALTMFITVLPKSDETYTCLPKSNSTSPMVYMKRMLTIISGGGLSLNGNHVYCGDYIFSGHTVTLTMAALAIKQYSPKKFLLLHWVTYTISLVGVIFLLIGRGHYSIDVLIAYYLTTRLWWTYHTLANTALLKTQGEHNSFDSLCWWHVFRWFEDKVTGPLPNRYSLPLPRRVKKMMRKLGNRLWETCCGVREETKSPNSTDSDA